ncbi:MAG: hypothetical protein COT84_04780 [Chlamydiae bacterium CG10_big_fil_rev_8_21_14_0_10_35_9]|nr:MAG: hypothetical protein COT84_04780 [Chlamydiae bacterium CG10_big_fil_rev_8_21_14_0_10_35_9]
MHYLIDGYNLLFHIFRNDKSLEEQRKAVLELLQKIFKKLSGEVTIIFDGNTPDLGIHQLYFLNIVYTHSGLSADEYILEKLQYSSKKMQYTVISSDRELVENCKMLGAKTMSIKEFLKWIREKTLKEKKKALPEFKDSQYNIDRLLKIFEKKLKDSD